jgi:hypothetical protein
MLAKFFELPVAEPREISLTTMMALHVRPALLGTNMSTRPLSASMSFTKFVPRGSHEPSLWFGMPC